METKEKLIDVKLSNILNVPHHDKKSKNDQWMKWNEIFVSRQNTFIAISGRRGEAGALEGFGHARVSNLHLCALATSAMTPWTRRVLVELGRRRLVPPGLSFIWAKHARM